MLRDRHISVMILGDLFAILVLTLIGFASHAELTSAGWRLLTTFLPVSVAWLISAYFLGALDVNIAKAPSQLWKPAIAMFFAAPLAVILRGLWLNRPIIPIFAVVLTASAILCMLVWRAILCFFWRR